MKPPAKAAHVVLAGLICLGAVARASEPMLVLTEEEFEANLSYRERGVEILRKPTDPLAPQILVERPDVESDVVPPVDVAIRFEPADGSTINLDSLRVKYGWFDITKRVLETMEVSQDGINGKITSMRRGKYALRVSISDTLERKSDAKIIFTVIRTAEAD